MEQELNDSVLPEETRSDQPPALFPEPLLPSERLSDEEETRPDQPPALFPQSLYVGLALTLSFVVGLAAGFWGRPLVIKDVPIEVVVTVAPNPAALAEAPITAATALAVPPTTEPTEQPAAGPTPTIMDFVLSDARHFQGDDGSPVTIVEFSDFK